MKQITASAIAMSLLVLANSATANTGQVEFIGAVTDQTCNIYPEVGGLIKSTIDLGTMKTDGTGAQEVNFKLVPDTQECLEKTSASVGWQSAGFNAAGLANMKGDATGAAIELIAVNSKSANEKVTFNKQNIEFENASGIGAFEFKTKMVKSGTAAATPGTVIATASYAVAYK
ncbi:fimbrial protein [Pseudenterobacter timonensis]|uniref:Fimbrial protein n=1 Tax=Pseudenterobacter timonensis TaxID=1755099 RepID=A0AAE4IVK5_9ENTR|nr:fimbrial protein [Pseudenterobacter timonensis]MDR9891415.1 fimbrial protein [Pseudenterobacter timonensis]